MKTQNNTVLITGGSAGIGFEIAKLFAEKGNTVIITGRNAGRLQKAAALLKNVVPIVSDVSKEEDVNDLVHRLKSDFPELNLVINNAGHAVISSLGDETVDTFKGAEEEMHTNYLSVIRLNERLLPVLKSQTESAIVNVSSIVAFVPGKMTATYSASKAALHSYTQSLRLVLAPTSVKVFELMPPLVNTEFSQEIGGANGIPPIEVAEHLFRALEGNEYEIHVGKTADMYKLFLSSPADALIAMNNR